MVMVFDPIAYATKQLRVENVNLTGRQARRNSRALVDPELQSRMAQKAIIAGVLATVARAEFDGSGQSVTKKVYAPQGVEAARQLDSSQGLRGSEEANARRLQVVPIQYRGGLIMKNVTAYYVSGRTPGVVLTG